METERIQESTEGYTGDRVRIYPVTRIRGRADIEVSFTPNQEVVAARLRGLDFRGFEQLVAGMHAYRVPQVTSRICGSCGSFHQLASCMALEEALGCEVAPGSRAFRELLCWLWLANSHLLAITYLALPDYALPMSDAAVRNISGIYMIEDEAVNRLASAQSAFSEALSLLCAMPVHSPAVVVGGVSSVPGSDDLRKAGEILASCENDLRETMRLVEMLIKRNAEMMYTGTPYRGNYLAMTAGGSPSLLGDRIGVGSFDGEVPGDMEPGELCSSIKVEPVPWSYIAPVTLGEMSLMLVGPLARMNVGYGSDTPWAERECRSCREQWAGPLNREFFAFQGLALEVIWAWEKACMLLEGDSITSGRGFKIPEAGAGEGAALIDSPQGLLLHRATVDSKGMVDDYQVISPLQFSYNLLNEHLSEVALKIVKGIEISDVIAGRLQLAVRAFCPCIPCATH